MLNSTSTIFTMDIYKPYINPEADDRATVRMGRISATVALVMWPASWRRYSGA